MDKPMSELENFFILVESGKPINHPVTGSNLTMFFPDFDPENPPPPFEKFIRHPIPYYNQMQKYTGTTYEKQDGVWQDVHHIGPLSPEERNEKLSDFASRVPRPYESWVIDEENLIWTAPIPIPNDGKQYYWDEDMQMWIEDCTNRKLEFKIVLVKNPNELPADGPTDPEVVFMPELNDTKNPVMYKWKKNQWTTIPMTVNKPKLSEQIIIDAYLNGELVRVMGVLPTKNRLDSNYQGLIADAYIVDDIDCVFAWDGTNWVQVDVNQTV